MKSYFVTIGFTLFLFGAQAQSKFTAIMGNKGPIVEHTVTSGESLIYLGAKYEVSVSNLAKANNIKTDDGLKIGQKIKVPLTAGNLNQKTKKGIPVYYEVAGKDNLTTISRKFNRIDIKTLKAWNQIKKDAVPKGKNLIIGYLVDHGSAKKNEKTPENSDKKETAKTDAKKTTGEKKAVIGTSLNIRKGPDTDQPIVATAMQHDVLTVVRKVNADWVSVRTEDGKEGFAAAQFLGPIEVKGEPKKPATHELMVTGTTLNIRKGPGTDQPIVGTAQQNQKITVLKQVNEEWASVRTTDGLEGFAAAQFLGPIEEKTEAKKPVTRELIVVGTTLNIRKGPGTDQAIVATAHQNESITVLDQINEEWASVRTADGVEGYAASQYLGTEPVKEMVVASPAPQVVEKEVAKKDPSAITGVSSAPIAEANPVGDYDESGFFRKQYEAQTNQALAKEQLVQSGQFKTDKGWADAKYYLLMDGVASGTIVKVSNPTNNVSVYAKVLGDIKSLRQQSGPAVRISDAAATALRINANDFNVKLTY